jgi:hypothetical protein
MAAVNQRSADLDEDIAPTKEFVRMVDAFVRATLSIVKQQSRVVREDEATTDRDRCGIGADL